ncbi:MAG: exodeoxyribonuclease VII small subunit [Negativicutes bacterium]|nr:exodeoxyribonuclease VII small subunit [Negativicutes bacterium]
MTKKKEQLTFEEALQQLENIVRQLETGNLSLEEAMKCFEEGVKLSRFCQNDLNSAQQKIEKITVNEQGEVVLQPFALTGENHDPQIV